MFIIYFNLIAINVVFSRDEADDYIRELCQLEPIADSEFLVDFVQEDEDLFWTIKSRGDCRDFSR